MTSPSPDSSAGTAPPSPAAASVFPAFAASDAPPVFERRLRVRFSQCDPAGIVFYPQYLVMLHNLVEEWFYDGLGIDYGQLLGPRRIGMPLVRLECEFRAVSRMGDAVTLGLAVERAGHSSLVLALQCRGDDGLRMRARQLLVATDLTTHRARALPDDLRAALARLPRGDRPPAQ
ncbi:MAG: thioesterase family protein [Xylophilus ampelinus]